MEEQINIDQLTYRFLEKSEQSLYIDFYDQFNNILGVSKDQLLYHRAKEESSFLNIYQILVSFDDNPRRTIQYTKYLGCGNWMLCFALLIFIWRK